MAKLLSRAGTFNWNKSEAWEEEGTKTQKVPTNADDCLITAGSTITTAGSSTCRTLEVTGGELKVATNLIISAATQTKALNITGGTVTASAGGGWTFKLSNNTTTEIKCGGADFREVTFEPAGSTAVQFKLLDKMEASVQFVLARGTLDANNQNVTIGSFTSSGTNTRALKMGSGTWKVSGNVEISGSTESFTLQPETSTMEMTGTAKIFNLESGIAYSGKLRVVGDGIILRSGSVGGGTFTITTLELNNAGGAVGTKFRVGLAGEGQKLVVTNISTNAKLGSLLKLKADFAGVAGKWLISKASGAVELEYVEIENSKAEGGATWKAIHSVNLGGNEGWTIEEVKTEVRTLSVTQGQSISSPVKALGLIRSAVTQGQSYALVTRANKSFSQTQGQSLTLFKRFATSFSTTQDQSVGAPLKALEAHVKAEQAVTPKLGQAIAKRLVVTLAQQSPVLSKRPSKTLEAVTQASAVNMGKFTQKVFLVQQDVTITGQKDLSLIQVVEVTATPEVIKSLTHTLPPITQEAQVGMDRLSVKTIFLSAVTQGVSMALGKALGKNVAATQNTSSKVAQGISLRMFPIEQNQAAIATTEVRKQPFAVTQGQSANVGFNRTIHRLFAVTQETAVNVRKGLAKIMPPVVQSATAALGKRMQAIFAVVQKLVPILGPPIKTRPYPVSGSVIWVQDIDQIINNELVLGEEAVINNLGQYEAQLIPGNPDIVVFRLVKAPEKPNAPGSTKDPQWQP